MRLDLQPFVRWIIDEFEPACRADGRPGRYGRRPGQAELELYGQADMACVLHSIGQLHPTPQQWARWRDGFYELTDPATGYILERSPTHGKLHNTAFALAAMELLSIRPRTPLSFAQQYADRSQLAAFLDALDWRHRVYRCSHDGAGLASCMALAPGTVRPQWFAWYFELLDARFDPSNGMLGEAKPPAGDCDQIGGTFHYAFIYEHFNRRMPHPAACIDAVLGLQQPTGQWDDRNTWWLTLDGLYLLTRSARHSQHRVEDVRSAVRRSARLCHERVLDAGYREAQFVEGKLAAHTLTAAVSVFAECQQFLGIEEIATDWPLKLVLDRRPFI